MLIPYPCDQAGIALSCAPASAAGHQVQTAESWARKTECASRYVPLGTLVRMLLSTQDFWRRLPKISLNEWLAPTLSESSGQAVRDAFVIEFEVFGCVEFGQVVFERL